MHNLIEARLHFFRRYRSEAAQRLFLENERRLIDMIDRAAVTHALNRILTTPHILQTWSDPVVVAPTSDQMTAAFQEPVPRPEGSCSICQEQFGTEPLVRLRNCSHAFHRTCANTWYSRSVFCPLCRNDVRTRNA